MPFFQITLLDSAGGVLSSTPRNSYYITADSAAFDPSFHPYNGGSSNASGYYKKWTAVSIDLTPYFGRTITIDFKSADCSRGGHYGYAYIDASCDALRPVTGMCPGDSVALLVAPSGYNFYQWYDTLGHVIPAPLGNKDSLLILHGHPGNVYTVHMISAAGCLTVLTDTLRYSHISANGITSTKTCFMGHTGTATVIPQGGVYGYTYRWNPPLGDTTQTITGLAPGTYTVHVSSIRCTTSSFDTIVTVTSLPPPAILKASAPICAGDTFRFNPPVNPVNQWYMPPSLAPAIGIHSDSTHYISQLGIAGMYRDTMRDANACLQVYDDSLYIVKVTTSLTHIPEHCWMDSVASITDHSTGGVPPASYYYHWNGPNGYTGTGQTISSLHPGMYVVTTRETGHSCVTVDSLFIVSPPKPKDSLNITTSYCDGDTATTLHFLGATGPYTWYINNTAILLPKPEADTLRISNPDMYPQYEITYFANGCRRHDTLAVRTVPGPPFEPNKLVNVFSPNGDGSHDLFYPFPIYDPTDPQHEALFDYIYYYTERYHLEVYDRWGVLMFNTHDFNQGWDGTYNGKQVVPGTYYWIAHYTPRCIAKTTDIVNKGFVEVVH
jgi:gliding motility-associated-like protein